MVGVCPPAHPVEPKTAAMLMAITADKIDKKTAPPKRNFGGAVFLFR